MTKGFRVAAVQAAPAYLDRDATLTIVAEKIAKAGADDADLVVFPESFAPGYPDWVWRRRPWDDSEWFGRFQSQAVELDGAALDPVRAAATEAGVWVALGVTERSGGTLYNSVVYINRDGETAAVHRKLIPTGGERLVWGHGQGPVLTVVEMEGVRVGSLICWEMYMPLARAAMYQQGVDILLAPTWDNSPEWVSTLVHTAKEGQVFVVGVTSYLRGCDVPRSLPGADHIYGGADDHLSVGNTTIVAPGGRILEGPLTGSEGIVTATLDLDQIALGRRLFDPVGHYARPDILSLTVNNERRPS